MSAIKRIALLIAGFVVLSATVFVGLQAYLVLSSRDVLVREVKDGELVFKFWIDRQPLEEGDPSLLFEVTDHDGVRLQPRVTLGSAFSWYPSETLDLRIVKEDGVSAAVLGEYIYRPLAVWEASSGNFAPRYNLGQYESEWLSDVLIRLTTESRSCLGYLSQGEVECR